MRNSMKKPEIQLIVVFLLSLLLLSGVCPAGEGPDLKDEKARLSYSVGYQVGSDFLRQGKDINPEVLIKGVMDALSGHGPRITHKEMRMVLTELQRDIVAAQEKKMREEAEKNLQAGRAFLAENGTKEGVKTLPSGLQYKIVTGGTGKTPGKTDSVTVHYKGTLIDGTLFDSSYRRNKPATFSVNGVIAGWTEALQLMKEGATWRLFIPPELAYGDKRTGIIPPNSTLIFEVELISVQTGKE